MTLRKNERERKRLVVKEGTERMREIERDWSSKKGDTIMVLHPYVVIISQ